MILKDRKLLARLVAIEGIGLRELAAVAGYKSHTSLARLIRGEAPGLAAVPARRIADRLGVDVDALFLPDSSSENGQHVRTEEAV